jgi:serine/threonine protein kinase
MSPFLKTLLLYKGEDHDFKNIYEINILRGHLGKGSFGTVYQAIEKNKKELFAVKLIPNSRD